MDVCLCDIDVYALYNVYVVEEVTSFWGSQSITAWAWLLKKNNLVTI